MKWLKFQLDATFQLEPWELVSETFEERPITAIVSNCCFNVSDAVLFAEAINATSLSDNNVIAFGVSFFHLLVLGTYELGSYISKQTLTLHSQNYLSCIICSFLKYFKPFDFASFDNSSLFGSITCRSAPAVDKWLNQIIYECIFPLVPLHQRLHVSSSKLILYSSITKNLKFCGCCFDNHQNTNAVEYRCSVKA